ncbi:MAG: hypothetical protein JOY71_19730 [Acetobacteraceae bacterium]|nr:hypothetical protein [Acetobacteraceae bacterium]
MDGRTYVCRTEPGDSPALIAAKLAAQSRLDAITNLSGSSLTVPGASKIIARVAADAEAVKEIRRQLQDFRISCWCPTPESRDAAASAIDQSLANMQFFDLPDSTSGRLVFQSSTALDQSQDAALYRRDLLYSVEYATTQNATQPAMLFGAGTINAAAFIG